MSTLFEKAEIKDTFCKTSSVDKAGQFFAKYFATFLTSKSFGLLKEESIGAVTMSFKHGREIELEEGALDDGNDDRLFEY